MFVCISKCLVCFLGTKTAALAQKNSEATRVIAAQQEILEKELGEIQKVLLAMQVYRFSVITVFACYVRMQKVVFYVSAWLELKTTIRVSFELMNAGCLAL